MWGYMGGLGVVGWGGLGAGCGSGWVVFCLLDWLCGSFVCSVKASCANFSGNI